MPLSGRGLPGGDAAAVHVRSAEAVAPQQAVQVLAVEASRARRGGHVAAMPRDQLLEEHLLVLEPATRSQRDPAANACTACVLQNRTDILPFYQSSGWDTSCGNRNAIVANWCSIDPAGCANMRTGSCRSSCGL